MWKGEIESTRSSAGHVLGNCSLADSLGSPDWKTGYSCTNMAGTASKQSSSGWQCQLAALMSTLGSEIGDSKQLRVGWKCRKSCVDLNTENKQGLPSPPGMEMNRIIRIWPSVKIQSTRDSLGHFPANELKVNNKQLLKHQSHESPH